MPFTIDALDSILSYADIERGINLDLSLVSSTFSVVAKRYIERYRKKVEYYRTTIIPYEEFLKVKDTYPLMRFGVKRYLSRYLCRNYTDRFHTLYSSCGGSLSIYKYDKNGKYHSYNDEPAVVEENSVKEWYQHGIKHRKGNNPSTIRVFECFDDATFLSWCEDREYKEEKLTYVSPSFSIYKTVHYTEIYVRRNTPTELFTKVFESTKIPEDSVLKRSLKEFDLKCPVCCSADAKSMNNNSNTDDRLECPTCLSWIHQWCMNNEWRKIKCPKCNNSLKEVLSEWQINRFNII